jgi:hypothetical protein
MDGECLVLNDSGFIPIEPPQDFQHVTVRGQLVKKIHPPLPYQEKEE